MAQHKQILRELRQLNEVIDEFARENPISRRPGTRLRVANLGVWVLVILGFWWVVLGPLSGTQIPVGLAILGLACFVWANRYHKHAKKLRQPRTIVEKRALEARVLARHIKDKYAGKKLRRNIDPSVGVILEVIASTYRNLRFTLNQEPFLQGHEGSVFDEARQHAMSAARDAMAEALLIAQPYFGKRQSRTDDLLASAIEKFSESDFGKVFDGLLTGRAMSTKRHLPTGDLDKVFNVVAVLLRSATNPSRDKDSGSRKTVESPEVENRARMEAEQELAAFIGAEVASRQNEPEIVALSNILDQMQTLLQEVQRLRLTSSDERMMDDTPAARLERAATNLEQIRIAQEELRSGL